MRRFILSKPDRLSSASKLRIKRKQLVPPPYPSTPPPLPRPPLVHLALAILIHRVAEGETFISKLIGTRSKAVNANLLRDHEIYYVTK
jgi:hypothetical protein